MQASSYLQFFYKKIKIIGVSKNIEKLIKLKKLKKITEKTEP
jgi:hypothetical protein